jgi:glycosyltransferase involved in cell wall biosynthesis
VAKTVVSVLDSATGPIEVVVADDGSTDGCCDHLEALSRGPEAQVRVVRLREPRGAGMGRTLAIAASRGRIIWNVDAHMEFPLKGCFETMTAFALEKGAIVVPTIRAMMGGPQGCGAATGWHRDGKIACGYAKIPPEAERGTPVRRDSVIGACYGVLREVMDRLVRWPSVAGLWGYEESFLGAWAWYNDVPIYGFPAVEVKHLYSSERRVHKLGGTWGPPPEGDLFLNILANHLALFDPETYRNVWRPAYFDKLSEYGKGELLALERGALWEVGSQRRWKKHDDTDYFRDVLHVPAVPSTNVKGAVERVRDMTVIVTARNEGLEVHKTLASIINAGQMYSQIVLVDDASTDNSIPPEFVERLRAAVASHWRDSLDSRLLIIRHETPAGISASRREALDAARGDLITIMDAHQRVCTTHGLEMLATEAQAMGAPVVPACCNLGMSRKTQDRTWGAQMVVKPKWGLYNKHIAKRPEFVGGMVPRNAVIGCGYTFNRETLKKLGGLPKYPGVWAYSEQWLGLRAWLTGTPLYCHTGVHVEHLYKKEFNYEVPHIGTMLNAHILHYVHFGDEAYENFFRPCLMLHGFDPQVDMVIHSPEVEAMREEFTALKKAAGKTDEQYFSEVLQIPWPPVWRDPA